MNCNDDLCLRCPVQGQCCYSAVQKSNGDVVGLRTLPCKYLTKSNTCGVYDKRFEMVPQCLTVEKAIQGRALPNECLYVKELQDYKGKEMVTLEEEKEILKHIVKKSRPRVFYPDNFNKIIKKYHEKKY